MVNQEYSFLLLLMLRLVTPSVNEDGELQQDQFTSRLRKI